MGAQKTATMKNKHAGPKATGAAKGAKRSGDGPASKSKKPSGPIMSKQITKTSAVAGKKKKRVYTEKELGIPALNMITPVGVVKPKGKKKGKVFVDDNEGMNTIMAMVQAEQNGQIESKMIKARQMEQIREARKAEQEKRDEERKERLEEKKASLRKKRNKKTNADDSNADVREAMTAGTKSRKKVSFA